MNSLRSRRRLGLGLWIGAAVVLALWAALRTGSIDAPAMSLTATQLVSAVEDGRVASMPVKVLDSVVSGDVVVRMDPSLAEHEKSILSAELLAAQEGAAAEVATWSRQFGQGLESASLDRAKLGVSLAEDQAMVDSLRTRVDAARGLAGQGATSSWELEDLERQLAVASSRVQTLRAAVGVADNGVADAQARFAQAPSQSSWSVVAAERRVELADLRVASLDLKAAMDGEVASVLHGPGDVIVAGEPILRIRAKTTSEAVAYVDPASAATVDLGASASIVRPNGEQLDAVVSSVGSGPTELPAQLWRAPNEPEWGVPVRLRLLGATVGPDEALRVRM